MCTYVCEFVATNHNSQQELRVVGSRGHQLQRIKKIKVKKKKKKANNLAAMTKFGKGWIIGRAEELAQHKALTTVLCLQPNKNELNYNLILSSLLLNHQEALCMFVCACVCNHQP